MSILSLFYQKIAVSLVAFAVIISLAKFGKICYGGKKQDRGAGTTMLWEPAGWEHSGCNLAELRTRARVRGGGGEDISVTVCGGILRSCAIY